MAQDMVVATQVLDALGTAWTIHGLYPDPESQPAFRRSLEVIGGAVTEPVSVDVRGGGFLVDGEPVELTREGTERLARRLFLHGVETLRVLRAPRDDEVVRLFEVLAKEDEEVQRGGGVEAAMLRGGIEAFAVAERAPLVEAAGDEVVDRDDAVVRALDEGADPEQFAQSLVAEAGEDPDALAELFTERFRDVYGRVTEEDVAGREEVVRVFVESFFYLPDQFQVTVFERFLSAKDLDEHQLFLDQFAGHELARLAPRLDPQGFSLLLDYARISTDQADKRPDELLGLIDSGEGLRQARAAVVAGMQQRMSDVEESVVAAGESFENLRTRHPDMSRFFYKALEVFRALLEVEDRPHRFERLLRIWTGKIGGSIRQRQFRRAELWLRAATDHPTYPSERGDEVRQALLQLGTPDLLEILVGRLAEGREGEAQGRLLQALGPPAVDSLVELLGAESEPAGRRALMDVLTVAARKDPAPLVAHLDDERWFVVRNLVIVLGRIGKPEVATALMGLQRHGDHRVRIEALRALPAVMGRASVKHLRSALQDPHERVRHIAVGLLGTAETEEAVDALVEGLESGRLEVAERRRIIEVLSESESPRAAQALERMADQRFVFFSSTRREMRDAARRALTRPEAGDETRSGAGSDAQTTPSPSEGESATPSPSPSGGGSGRGQP